MTEDILAGLHRRMTYPFENAEDGLLVAAAAREIESMRCEIERFTTINRQVIELLKQIIKWQI